MELAALVSGGKDSMLAMYRMHLEGHRIKYLLTMEPESTESYMFHHPNTWISELISEAAGIPLIKGRTHGRKEEELSDLSHLLGRVVNEVDGIVSGALASSYQKSRIDSLCRELGLKSIAPLWHMDAHSMWNELFERGFIVMITAVAAAGLDEKWLGKIIDQGIFNELVELSNKYRFHLGFEGGEAETLVVDMPLYKKRIAVKMAESVWDGTRGTYVIKNAALEEKQ